MLDYLTANYHTHTFRCLHASGTEREYIERAIDVGMDTLGFSDHIPCPYQQVDGSDYVSPIRMTWNQADEYVQTIRSLGQEYKNDIRILVGFEAEYVPKYFYAQQEMCKRLGIDYMIMGQHFWNSEVEGPYAGSPTKDEARIRTYVDSVIAGLKTGAFSYLAHPDLINYQGLESVYEFEMERMCRELLTLDIPLEVNMLGFHEGRQYPNFKFWEIAARVGNKVIIGADAHAEDGIADWDAFEGCIEIVKTLQLPLLERLDI